MLWQHIVLCKSTLLGMRLAMVCVVCYVVTDWLWIMWEDSCCACELVEGAGARCNSEDNEDTLRCSSL